MSTQDVREGSRTAMLKSQLRTTVAGLKQLRSFPRPRTANSTCYDYEEVILNNGEEENEDDGVRKTNDYVKMPTALIPTLADVPEKGRTWLKEGELVMFHDHPIGKSTKMYYGQRILRNNESQHVAVKLMRRADQNINNWESVRKFRHRNVIQIYDCGECYVLGKKIYVVMQLCRKNLRNYVVEDCEGPMKVEKFINLFKQLLDALDYIHQNNIIHKAINLDNILISGDGKIKISGFSFTNEQEVWINHGYGSPEMYEREPTITNASDVFQLGLVATYLVTTGKHPFGCDPYEWCHNIRNNENMNFSIIETFEEPYSQKTEELVSMLRKMMDHRPEDRLSIQKIKSDVFFQGIRQPMLSVHQEGKSTKQQQALDCPPQYYVALYDFGTITKDDLRLVKGDHIVVIDDSNANWWMARSVKTGQEGYVPYNYVEPAYTIYSEEWFFGEIKRDECEGLLLDRKNVRGTYMIRDSISKPDCYTLSVLDRDEQRKPTVKHYLVKRAGKHYSIRESASFKSVKELVQHHTAVADGLCCRLTNSCPRDGENDGLQISPSQLEMGEKIGSGNFGNVYKGSWNGKTVAIKTYKKTAMSSDEFLVEAHMMRLMRHEKLVTLYGVVYDDPLCIVTEWMCNGNLRDYLRQGEGRFYKFPSLVYMAEQVAEGMMYMEKRNYIHRDLRAANVMVGEESLCKIGDFGLARLINDNEYQSRKDDAFPTRWMPPEVLTDGRFTIKSDVWSFGILLTEILSKGKKPYEGLAPHEVSTQVRNGYRSPKPIGCPIALYAQMQVCWHDDPLKRPNFKHLHKILNELTEYRNITSKKKQHQQT